MFYGCTTSVSHHCSRATSSNSATSSCAFQVPWQALVNSHIRYFFSQMIRQSSALDYMAVSDEDHPDKVLRTESFPLLMRQDSSRCTFFCSHCGDSALGLDFHSCQVQGVHIQQLLQQGPPTSLELIYHSSIAQNLLQWIRCLGITRQLAVSSICRACQEIGYLRIDHGFSDTPHPPHPPPSGLHNIVMKQVDIISGSF